MFKQTMVAVSALVLTSAGLYAAPPRVETFEYKFDSKDSIEGWTANGEAKIEWKEGGANKDPGCMKVAGDHASADSPMINFTCGDNVISFDYFAHGTEGVRLRLAVASEENRTKYGRYGNFFIRKVEQDTWNHVEVKLADVPGMAEAGKAKAFPELGYNRIGLCSIAGVADGGYILFDNVKMGKPGGEAAPAPTAAPAPAPAPGPAPAPAPAPQ